MTTTEYTDAAGRGGEIEIGDTWNISHVVGASPERRDKTKHTEARRGGTRNIIDRMLNLIRKYGPR